MKDIIQTAIRFTLIGAVLASLAASGGAQAQDDVANGLIVGEMAGACRILSELMSSKEAKRLPGGAGFVVHFVNIEAARLGWTPHELFQRCTQAAAVYAEFTAEPTPASGPSTTAGFILAGPAR